jgi:hypothetical protein
VYSTLSTYPLGNISYSPIMHIVWKWQKSLKFPRFTGLPVKAYTKYLWKLSRNFLRISEKIKQFTVPIPLFLFETRI